MSAKINLKVLVIDHDFYAQHALDSYMAWDRRTRVIALVSDIAQGLDVIHRLARAELPDVILLDAEICVTPDSLRLTIEQLRTKVPDVMVICLAHRNDPHWAAVAMQAGARGYLLRNEVQMHLVGAICFALDRPFIVTRSFHNPDHLGIFDSHLLDAKALPKEREYPEMTERIRQALWLCVIEGMSAQLAADEMGVSPHTIRSYIKEGYRILKAHDNTEFPKEMSPEEQAFMRFTALANEEDAE